MEPRKALLQELLDGHSIEEGRKKSLLPVSENRYYFCARISVSPETILQIPVSYILDYLERSFPGCIAFEYKQHIAAFIPINDYQTHKNVLRDLRRLMKELHLTGGVSCPFNDLTASRIYWRQASIVITMGEENGSGEICHYFQDYKLSYMCECCTGEFPLEHMLFPGLKRLLKHDADSQISYIKTLKLYLDNNMNLTQTAAKLFVHRTTLIERIKRIESLLDIDLTEPDNRLYLLLSLKRLEMKEQKKSVSPTDA